jgi:transcriptional regulator with XRE-family HTH domain
MSTVEVADEPTAPPLSELVAAIRKATGWSQNAVARRARINQGQLSLMLSGKQTSKPAEQRVRRLAERLQKAGKLPAGNGGGA